MVSRTRLTLAFLQLATASKAAQAPLHSPSEPSPTGRSPDSEVLEKQNSGWRFDIPLSSSNTTSNHLFDGVSSLLQLWGNARYRNGHNIVPVTIPTGTLLYHGTYHNVTPTTPEFVAVDPEHSYLFCRWLEEGKGCYHLTLAATRPLNMLYFDGGSAAMMHGCMDAQDLMVWGEVKPERLSNDYGRIKFLCEWGKKYNLDGFLRMQANFEIMLCDFANGVEEVSFLNLVSIGRILPPKGPPPERPTKEYPWWSYNYLLSGQWHRDFPGETRVKLDLSGIISFYDKDLFPSLSRLHSQHERWEHRVGGLDKPDIGKLMERLDEILNSKPAGSGVDWSSLYRVIVRRYSDRLDILRYMLDGKHMHDLVFSNKAEKIAFEVHEYIASMLTAYVLNDVRPRPSEYPHGWASLVFETCATTHTKYISRLSSLTNSEKMLLQSVNDVLHEICRVVVGIWAEGMELGLHTPGAPTTIVSETRFDELVVKWADELDGLIKWLDWSALVKCDPACGFEVSVSDKIGDTNRGP